MLKQLRLIIVGLLFFAFASTLAASTVVTVLPVDVTVVVDAKAERTSITLPIRDVRGRIVYALRCRGGSDAFVEERSIAEKIDYSPPLTCVMTEEQSGSHGNLLADFAICESVLTYSISP